MPLDSKRAREYALKGWDGKRIPLADRFWSKVNRKGENECWEWKGYRSPLGYGKFGLSHHVHGEPAKVLIASRVAWELTNGPIPDNLLVLHRCDNPPCVNPNHLWLGTYLDNNRDMNAKGRNGRPAAKLTVEQVREIRKRYNEGENQTRLGKQFGVTNITIHMIVQNKRWKDVV